ncbi:hypothetical protein AB0N05_08445 [Nocardia sp. NPDC051030]|uniref:hypothetical protein n=1 Tax=Nocardia sp. NPDC051030 TaxID=3155162 RepID=UPI003446D86D
MGEIAVDDQGYEPYPITADGHAYDSHEYQPYGQVPSYPTKMPGTARAAQIISWLFGGIGIALSVLAGVLGKPELCGTLIGGFLPAFFLALFAFGYTANGNGLRVAAIVFASIGILWGLSAMTQAKPPGLLGFGASLAIVILLSKRSAGDWFKRPH